ncbi:MAG: VOC family protein [Acidiferrobacteraceae bacterium]
MSAGRVLRLLRVSRTVSDLAEVTAFYRDAMNFRVIDEATFDGDAWGALMGVSGASGRSVMMRLGDQDLELLAFDPPGDAYPMESVSADQWFQHVAIVVGDITAAYTRLCGYSVKPISEDDPQQLPPTSGCVTAFKFRDPEGHPVELIHFPSGTGNVIWQQKRELFCGIDHTALDVTDMTRSVDFYTRLFGLSVTSRSVNSGPEQERLDDALDVLVDVVALQPAMEGPPHVELLGYERPSGRPIPEDTKSNDVVSDRLVLQVHNLPQLQETLEAENIEFVSPGMVTFRGGRRGAQVRDPTGHMLVLLESDSP